MQYIILFGFVIGGVVAILFNRFPDAVSTPQDIASIIQLSLIGLMLCSSVLYLHRKNPSSTLKNIALWLVIGFIFFAGYALKDSLLPALFSGHAEKRAGGTLAIRAAADGHFYMQANVNGQPVRFLIDTGASNISLPQHTAERLGIDQNALEFIQPVDTANGQTFSAPIILDTLEIGGHIFSRVPASVNQGALKTPLLGIRFLSSTSSIEIRDDELIIEFGSAPYD